MIVPLKSIVAAAGVAFCATTTIATGMESGVEGTVIQFGAFGLCCYMVFQNYRDRAKLLAVIEQQTADLVKKNDEVTQLHIETIKVIGKCGGSK